MTRLPTGIVTAVLVSGNLPPQVAASLHKLEGVLASGGGGLGGRGGWRGWGRIGSRDGLILTGGDAHRDENRQPQVKTTHEEMLGARVASNREKPATQRFMHEGRLETGGWFSPSREGLGTRAQWKQIWT
ncbi:MAG: hypothetical protein HC933_01680 [Pleurocapsa sp. SU_196_0]|nr:hypothetical protein [Pleurocapsa sp. SU_196_0]